MVDTIGEVTIADLIENDRYSTYSGAILYGVLLSFAIYRCGSLWFGRTYSDPNWKSPRVFLGAIMLATLIRTVSFAVISFIVDSNSVANKTVSPLQRNILVVLFTAGDWAALSAYLAVMIMFATDLSNSRAHLLSTHKLKRDRMTAFIVLNVLLYSCQLILYLLVFLSPEGNASMLFKAFSVSIAVLNGLLPTLTLILYSTTLCCFAGFPFRSKKARRNWTRMLWFTALWSFGRLAWCAMAVMLSVPQFLTKMQNRGPSFTLLFLSLLLLSELAPYFISLTAPVLRTLSKRAAGVPQHLTSFRAIPADSADSARSSAGLGRSLRFFVPSRRYASVDVVSAPMLLSTQESVEGIDLPLLPTPSLHGNSSLNGVSSVNTVSSVTGVPSSRAHERGRARGRRRHWYDLSLSESSESDDTEGFFESGAEEFSLPGRVVDSDGAPAATWPSGAAIVPLGESMKEGSFQSVGSLEGAAGAILQGGGTHLQEEEKVDTQENADKRNVWLRQVFSRSSSQKNSSHSTTSLHANVNNTDARPPDSSPISRARSNTSIKSAAGFVLQSLGLNSEKILGTPIAQHPQLQVPVTEEARHEAVVVPLLAEHSSRLLADDTSFAIPVQHDDRKVDDVAVVAIAPMSDVEIMPIAPDYSDAPPLRPPRAPFRGEGNGSRRADGGVLLPTAQNGALADAEAVLALAAPSASVLPLVRSSKRQIRANKAVSAAAAGTTTPEESRRILGIGDSSDERGRGTTPLLGRSRSSHGRESSVGSVKSNISGTSCSKSVGIGPSMPLFSIFGRPRGSSTQRAAQTGDNEAEKVANGRKRPADGALRHDDHRRGYVPPQDSSNPNSASEAAQPAEKRLYRPPAASGSP